MATESIREIRHKAEECLRISDSVIRRKAKHFEQDDKKYCTWQLTLEENPEGAPKETCAIACGILAAITCGGDEARQHPLVREALELLKDIQQDDGGWTSVPPPPGEKEDSLVLDTYYALIALVESGEDKSSRAIQDAVDWLLRAPNPANGGWGFVSYDYAQRDVTSYVLPTCYAIRALCAVYSPRDIEIRDPVNRALNWLEDDCRNPNGAYGRAEKGIDESAVHTAAAIMTLLSTGRSQYAIDIRESAEWLLENLNEREHIEDHYEVPMRDATGKIIPGRMKRRISHVTFPEGFILQALVKSGTDLLDTHLRSLVLGLIENQKEGCWKCENRPPEQQPIYSVMDACLGLRHFISEVDRKEQVLDLLEGVARLQRTVEHQTEALNNITNEVATLKHLTAVVKPVARLLDNVKTYPLVYIFGSILVLYVIIASALSAFSATSGMVVGVIEVIVAALHIILFYYPRRSKDNKRTIS